MSKNNININYFNFLINLIYYFSGSTFGCLICSLFVDEASRLCFVILQFCFIIIELILLLILLFLYVFKKSARELP